MYVEGDVKDLEDVVVFMNVINIYIGEYVDVCDVDIVVIMVGVFCKFGESCLDLINCNMKILEFIVKLVVVSGFNGCFVILSNFVDILILMM